MSAALATLAIAAIPAFVASIVEWVEAFTIVLAVGNTRGWRSPIWGTIGGLGTLAVIVVAWLVSPVFRVFLAALSADVRMIRSHRRLLGTRLTRNINPAKTHYTQIAGRGQVTHLNSKHYIVILARHHRTNHGCDGSSGMPSTSHPRMPPACFMLWQLMHIDIKPSIAVIR